MHVLFGTPAEVDWLEPIKKGECGLPAPVRLKSIGSNPKVFFDPPVDVNCPLVAALGTWVKSTLQPHARERLKSEVVRIVGASGYSCRNVYNRANGRLSQHAHANAIDIGGFGLANGKAVYILKGWGLTKRDIAAQAKAKAVADAKATKGTQSKSTMNAVAQTAKAKTGGGDTHRSGTSERPVVQASTSPTSLLLQKKSTGAAQQAAAPEPPKPTKEALFLRAIHGDACQKFGTVLGPEANDPHRNHFHFDLISRPGRAYCQ